jgi:hypothetical protein
LKQDYYNGTDFLLLTAAFYLLMPKVKTPQQPDQVFEKPTATLGTPIPVLFGTRKISPLIGWTGDFKVVKVAVKSRGKKG